MKLSEYKRRLEESKEYTEANKKLKIKFSLAKAVYEARTRKNWSQKELAKAIGTKQANISRVESGLANPTLEFLSKLTNVLDLKIEFACVQEPSIQYISEPAKNVFNSKFIDIRSIEDFAYEVTGENRQVDEIKEYA